MTEDQARRHLAANVQRLLASRGLTQSELARRTGDAQTTISRVVRAENVANLSLAARIAEALETTIDYLIAPPADSQRRKTA